MARLILKANYHKPNAEKKVGGYAKYIATREGVDKVDESFKLAPSSVKQQKLIEKILRDFPDTKDTHEYEDYLAQPTLGNASEFISRAIEDNAVQMESKKTYADYIATRPRAEKFGTHGLFTDDGVEVKLDEVSRQLNEHGGNVWTLILSLRREDAQRLGFDTGTRWRDMLRGHTESLARNLKIPMENLKWYAAFHNEGHHPHVHIIAYSENETEGYLTPQGIDNLRSEFARDIFSQDLISVYQKQTEHRDELRAVSRERIAEIVRQINEGSYDNPVVEEKLALLAQRLSRTKGKKQYGYLKADVKAIVCSIVDELAKDERLAELYDLWYEQKEETLKTYQSTMPDRVSLSQNEEFKPIRNAVINETMNIVLGNEPIEELPDTDAPDDEPTEDEADEPMTWKERKTAMWDTYRKAKAKLRQESDEYDPHGAVELLMESAKLGNPIAKYQLGKLFYQGEHLPRNIDYALRWLEEACEDKNQYAEYLLGKIHLNGDDVEQDADRAEELLRRAANQGNKYAQYTLGKALLDGKVLPQDIPEALRMLKASANQGFPQAEYTLGKLLYEGKTMEKDLTKAIEYLEKAAERGNAYAAYLAGKIRLTEDTVKDIEKAIRYFEIAAKAGNAYAEYQLGRLFFFGNDVPKDEAKGMDYFKSSAEHGNEYAEKIINSIKSNRNWSAGLGALRLFRHLGRTIQNAVDERQKGIGAIDRKLRRRIEEKKQAHGLKHE